MRISWKSTVTIAIFLSFGLLLAACEPAEPPEATAEVVEEEPVDNSADSDESPEEDQETAEESDASDASQVEEDAATESEPPSPEGDFDIYDGAEADDFTTTDSGLQYRITDQGDGPTPEPGEIVSVHYTGYLTNGLSFDSSIDRGQPFGFPLGMGRVIQGWDEGIGLLPVGSKARLIIPPELGYGERGAGAQIPPGATLVFDVELVEILPPPPDSPTAVDESDFITTDSGLKYYDIEEGDGPPAESGQVLTVHYTGWLEDGTRFDSSLLQGQPVPFILGAQQVIPGWDEGFVDMKVGGKRQLVIPPELAFGEAGAGGGVIPPNATLIFEMELLEAAANE